jgi:hypothetical protein
VPSESTPSVRADLLDTDLLQELSMLDRAKPGLLTDLHNRFLARRGAQLQELDTASEQGDLDRIRSLCHSIKGGAGASELCAPGLTARADPPGNSRGIPREDSLGRPRFSDGQDNCAIRTAAPVWHPAPATGHGTRPGCVPARRHRRHQSATPVQAWCWSSAPGPNHPPNPPAIRRSG